MDENFSVSQTTNQSSARAQGGFSTWKALQTVIAMAILIATLFTLWTPANLFSNQMLEKMFKSFQPSAGVDYGTATPAPRPRVGLVAGHLGHDSGAVCSDGLTEATLNLEIVTMVKEILNREGYDVDILKEFDPRLLEYRSLALVSVHNDSCDYINDQATGFKVAAAIGNSYPEKAMRLTSCLTNRYQASTRLPFHYNTITADMTEYHAFNEIHSDTPAAIIETGFMNLDRDLLTNNTDLVSQGVASGILCYIRNEDVSTPTLVTPTPEFINEP
jgi:N-acetylmuramoyl-L-alanine amidase